MLEQSIAVLSLLLMGPKDWRPPELRVAKGPAIEQFEQLREIALQYLGRPYVMGGVGNPGFDCSGFTCRVYAEGGYGLPRVSRDQARAGREIALDQIQPGDLLFFVQSPGDTRVNHVALYLGDGEIVHAASGEGKVVVAKLNRRWYQDRWIGARRFLPDGTKITGTATVAPSWKPPPEVASMELDEHDGEDALPPMLRLPSKLPEPSLGPNLSGFGATAFAARGAAITEDGVLGLVLAPEVTIRIESIALEAILAVPIRLELNESPTVGAIDDAGDALKFVRSVSFGLRGADLELRLDRLGDASLAGRFVVDHLQPAAAANGVPGLTVQRTPLTLFAGYRERSFEVDVVVDDVTRPGVSAIGGRLSIIPGMLRAGLALATDQRAENQAGGRRAINAQEAALFYDAIDTKQWSLVANARGATSKSLGETGFGLGLGVEAELRLGRGGTRAIRAEANAAWLGPRFIDAMFGPTYAADRPAHLDGLRADQGRPSIGAEVGLRFDSLSIGAGYQDGIGAKRHPLDRRTYALLELRDLSVGGTKVLDLRVAYAARALGAPKEDSPEVLHGGARLRLEPWLFLEIYAAKSDRLEGGAGLVVAWIP